MQYCIHFTCLKTRWTQVYCMVNKDDALEKFCEYIAYLSQLGVKPYAIIVRSDNAGEYVGGQFLTYCKRVGILQQTTAQYMHEQNGFAYVTFRDLFNCARAMLLTAGLDRQLWPLAVRHATWLRNRMPNSNNG